MAAQVRRFPTTQWSMVFTAQGVKTPDAREALERLFAIYWYPVYAFIRSRTPQAADAEDLTQGFFASLIGLRSLDAVRPEYGRFRAFLLRGDVFTEELIETFIDYKRKNEAEAVRLRPHPYEFALYYDI